MMDLTTRKEDKIMDLREASRIIPGPRAAGRDDKSITDLSFGLKLETNATSPRKKRRMTFPALCGDFS
jgi:hypothetical protein